MSHTPGPWKLVEREILEDGSVYPRHIVGGEKQLEICKLESVYAAMEASKDPESFWNASPACNANAALIAAAPELLWALELVISTAENKTLGTGSLRNHLDLLQQVRAAIAKARGRG